MGLPYVGELELEEEEAAAAAFVDMYLDWNVPQLMTSNISHAALVCKMVSAYVEVDRLRRQMKEAHE